MLHLATSYWKGLIPRLAAVKRKGENLNLTKDTKKMSEQDAKPILLARERWLTLCRTIQNLPRAKVYINLQGG